MAQKITIVVLLLSFWWCNGYCQNGDFYLSQFSPYSDKIDNQNFDLIQDRYGVIYMANRSGVTTFDGHRWELIKTPYSIFSLSLDTAKNQIYAAGKQGIGTIDFDAQHELRFYPLLDSNKQINDVFKIIIHQRKLYALNQKQVSIYDLEDKTLSIVKPDYGGGLLQMFLFENQIYVNTSVSGLKLVGEKKLQNVPIASLRDKDVAVIVKKNNTPEYLIADESDTLSIYKNGSLRKLDLKSDQEYLSQAEVIDGIWVDDNLVALATLKGGVVFVNVAQVKIEEIVNYQSGLPDNEVFALSMDSNKGVWIAHSEGLTRVSPSFPFKSFDRYPGLEGKTLSVNSHKGKLFVGTSLGLYCLEEVKEYTEKVSLNKKNVRVKVPGTVVRNSTKQKKGLLQRLRLGRKKQKDKDSNPTIKYQNKTIYESVVEKVLDRVKYEFKKIPDINSKVFQLESYKNRLFSGGLDGLYSIQDSTSKVITSQPVRYYFISQKHQKIIVNTYSDKLLVYDISRGKASEIYAFGDFRDVVQYMFEDNNGRIWLCSPDEIYWVAFDNNTLSDTEKFAIDNPHYFNTYGSVVNDSVIFINEQGAIYFDHNNNKLQRLDSSQNISSTYLNGPNGTVYTRSANKWEIVGSDQDTDQLSLVSLFKNISYISKDQQSNYWIVTDKNQLYRLSSDYTSDNLTPYDLYLKKARNNAKSFIPKSGLKFNQDKNAITFEVAQPEYSGLLDIEYKYKLKGLPSKWSTWSVNNDIITFPYLPDGKYELLVRSRTALGTVTKMDPISFKVIPPYWKRPWFYFLEFSVIALILFISIKIKKLGYRYRLLSRLLALLVLIIIVEFIQTVAENRFGTQSSPVLDFIIQVTMAIIILPVESVLRKYIFKEKEVRVMDFIKLKDKKKSP